MYNGSMPITPDNWREKFLEADTLPPAASAQEKAQRGRDFEAILVAMFKEASLEPRVSFRPRGEEVDGSIWFNGRTVLFEAKWTAAAHSASSLYQFKGKVDGKLVGTLGLFISINGFSPDAVNALVAGKEKNIILADGADIRAVAEGRVTVAEALYRKIRVAGEEGAVFWAATQALPESRHTGSSAPSKSTTHIVVVEGRSDVRYLEAARQALGLNAPVTFVPAGGPLNMPPLIRAMLEGSHDNVVVTAVVDGDFDQDFRDRMLRDVASVLDGRGARLEIVAAEPDLETVLGLNPKGLASDAREHLRRPSAEFLAQALSRDNLLARGMDDMSLERILRVISGEHYLS